MPPKRSKKVQSGIEDEEGSPVKVQAENNRGTEKFKCDCGKQYGSLAAVHTHINNKHPEQKKKFKGKIVNPNKSGQQAVTSIRMKDIAYPEIEAELMCLADINLKKIYDAYKRAQKSAKKDILINIEDDLSDDSEIGDMIEIGSPQEKPRQSSRQASINKKVKDMEAFYNFKDLDCFTKGAEELKPFKQQKFTLSLIKELTKFFVQDFAANLEFSLQLIHANKQLDKEKDSRSESIGVILDKIWSNYSIIKGILVSYYDEWNQIRFGYQKWKKQKKQEEKDREPDHQENDNFVE